MNFESNIFCESCGLPDCQNLECYFELKYNKTKPMEFIDTSPYKEQVLFGSVITNSGSCSSVLLTNKTKPMEDKVNHPSHYTSHPSGIEAITITRHHDFCIGSAIKYLWRAGLKFEEGMTGHDKQIQDLKKAVWYINDKIKQLEDASK